MTGIELLVIVLVVFGLGGATLAKTIGGLNKRRRERVGDKDLGVDDARYEPGKDGRPMHRHVTNDEQAARVR
jgi:hypothetical protein